MYPENCSNELRVPFLSSVLYEMSFNGYTREEHEAIRAEVSEGLAEAYRIMALPPEKRKKYEHNLVVEEADPQVRAEMQESEETDWCSLKRDCAFVNISQLVALRQLGRMWIEE